MLLERHLLVALVSALSLILPPLCTAGTTEAGLQYLADKRALPDVIETSSGLLYKVIEQGTGQIPTLDSLCEIHFVGELMDGTLLYSTRDSGDGETVKLSPAHLMEGWKEALLFMKEGTKLELYIKSELAYGDEGTGENIKPGAVLVCELELIKIHEAAPELPKHIEVEVDQRQIEPDGFARDVMSRDEL